MRVTSPATARPWYYDRNPSPRALTCNTTFGAAAAAATVRATRTVPAGKKAYVEFVNLGIWNSSATGLNNNVLLQVLMTQGGSSEVVAQNGMANGQTGYGVPVAFGGAGELNAGDVIELRDLSDNNAAGTSVTDRGGVKLTEFDA